MNDPTAGDTLDFTVAVRDRSAADGWVLHYRLIAKSGTAEPIEFESVPAADGVRHRLLVDAATTAEWPAGTYSWASWVELAAERYSQATGTVRVLPDPATATAPIDLRTFAQIALDDAEAALAAWKPTMRSYTIGGRQMQFGTAGDVLPIIAYWKAAVQREQRAAAMAKGMADPRKFQVRLGRV